MSNGYEEHLTIDRINVNGNYEPSNCRWITLEKQADNRRNTIRININGTTKTLAEWADYVHIARTTLYNRYKTYGATEKILQPLQQSAERFKPLK